jgi:hypothetical protein
MSGYSDLTEDKIYESLGINDKDLKDNLQLLNFDLEKDFFD